MSFLHYEKNPVDLSNPGAKEARAIIKQYHTYLNSSDILPEQWARPSAGHFFLVSYVNTIIGLFISKNYEAIPLFIMRAFKFLQEVPESPVSKHYRVLVKQYLYQMAYFLQSFTATSEDNIRAFIPEEVLNAGSQPPPIDSLVSDAVIRVEQTDDGELS